MSINPAELWQKITTYSLALPDQCRQWTNDLARARGPAAALQTDEIVNYLRDQKILSNYQLDQLINATNPLLKVGPWRIEDRVAQSPFSQWFVGHDLPRNRQRWIFLINDSLLQQPEVCQTGPSLEWSKIQAAMKQTDGWNFEAPEKHNQQLLLIAQPLQDQLAGQLVNANSTSADSIALWIMQLARSLNELHQNRMVHGHIRPDRLWLDTQGRPLLLRDPLVPPTAASTNDPWSPLDRRLEPASRIHYVAPELSVPGQHWSMAADVYALGCLWYWLVTGQAPFQSSPLNQVAVQHAVSQLYVSESQLGGTRLAECFKFCVAKNPTTRFPHAGALAAALEVALAKKPSTGTTPAIAPVADKKKIETKAAPQATPAQVTPPQTPVPPPITTAAPPVIKTVPPVEPSASPVVKPPILPASAPNTPTPTAKPKPSDTEKSRDTVKPSDASKPSETIKSSGSVKPNDSAKLTDAAKPSETAKPIQTINPNESAKPSESAKAVAANPVPAKADPVVAPPPKPKTETTPATISKPQTAPLPTESSAPPAAKAKEIGPTESKPKTSEATAAKPSERAAVETESSKPTVTPPPLASQPAPATATTPEKPAVVAAPPVVSIPADQIKPVEPPAAAPTPPPVTVRPVAQDAPKPKTGTASGETQKKTAKKKSETGTGKKKKQTKPRPAWFLPTVTLGSLFFMSVLMVVLTQFTGGNGDKKPDEPKVVGNDPTGVVQTLPTENSNKPAAAPRDPVNDKFTVIRGDETLPWAPPTAGEPIGLAMLPPEAQAWLHWKPAKFAQDTQGQQLLTLLATDVAPATDYLTSRAGVALEDIKEVLVAIYPGKEGMPEIAVRFELNQALAISDLKSKWGNLQDVKVGQCTLLQNDKNEAYFISTKPFTPEQNITSFTVGPVKRLEELVALDGGASPLRRQLEQLHRTTDASADFTLLFAPGFLFTDGRQILATSVPAIREPLSRILATDMQAGLITTTLKPNWYVELRLIGNSDLDASRIAQDITKRLTDLPGEVESRMIAGSFDPSWGKLSVRYAQMLREMLKQLRVNVEEGQAIANFYLPNVAAPNMIVASWLAAHSSGGKTVLASAEEKPVEQPILTPEQFLDRPIKLSFDQESLEIALQAISEATAEGLPANQPRLAMELDYESMEKDGITQNQQIRQFKHDNKPLREALTELVKRGNPVPGVTDTTSADQKFLWVLIDAPDKPGGKLIRLTTRNNATEQKFPLTKEFAPASN